MIAVPTSVGYGVSTGGFVSLLTMLATSVPGVAVVTIDNGFDAACLVDRINQLARKIRSLTYHSQNSMTYVSVEPFHLFRYLDEEVFRFNDRKIDDAGRFLKLLHAVVGRRLTFKALTALPT